MPVSTLNATIRNQALLLAEEARRTDPNIIKFFWFPDENEVRLVEVATDMQPSSPDGEVQPFYFPPAPKHNRPPHTPSPLRVQGQLDPGPSKAIS